LCCLGRPVSTVLCNAPPGDSRVESRAGGFSTYVPRGLASLVEIDHALSGRDQDRHDWSELRLLITIVGRAWHVDKLDQRLLNQ
jgi:hypothetical protein